MPMIQGGNQPLVIQFDAAVDTLPQLVVSLWHDANCQPLKVWHKADMSIDDDTAICPISEVETAKLPPQRLIIEAKGLDENGTYDVMNLAQLIVNVAGGGGMNAQTAQSTSRSTSTTYTELVTLTCAKTGTYDVYWSTFRSSTSGTWGSQLYIADSAYGSAQTGSWSNNIQNIHLTGVHITAGQEVAVRVRSRGSSYYGYVGTLTIIQTA